MRSKQNSIPKAVYHQCVWILKDIERLRRLEAVGCYAGGEDEMVFFVDDEEVIKSAEVIEQAKWKLECIRRAMRKVPSEYRQSTLDCIIYNVPYGDMAHENTWRKWRQVFIEELAKNLFLI